MHRFTYRGITISSRVAAVIMIVLLSAGCAHSSSPSDGSTSVYSDFLTIDVYDTSANYNGIQSGWYASIIKAKFNMELNIISPSISGGSDNLFESRFTAGNVGDIIICPVKGEYLQRLVDSGLIINMDTYIENSALYGRYSSSIDSLNRELASDGIYAIPNALSSASPYTPSESYAPTYGTYLRWDYYSEMGYPPINTLEDLLPILADMQAAHPYSDSGAATYAFSLFKDWDNNMMNAIKQPCCFYGYDEYGFVLSRADGSDFQNILDTDSLYMRVLRFYNKAYQMGLIDPDSPTQNYSDVSDKFADGQILFSPWPWLAQPAYNTNDNLNSGKGYMFVPIEDELIYSYGSHVTGSFESAIAIGAGATDPVRMANFIDWLYSNEGIMASCADSPQGTAGIEGLTWQMTDLGPELTDFGIKVFYSKDTLMPEEYGGGKWMDGICKLNYKPVSNAECTPDGYPYYFSTWDSVIAMRQSDIEKDWSSHIGSRSVMDYLQDNNALIVSPGVSYKAAKETTELSTIRVQCAAAINEYSWKMVFASDEGEFNSLYSDLLNRTTALGYSKIYEYDLTNAKGEADAKNKLSQGN